jgi:hypothetical protein
MYTSFMYCLSVRRLASGACAAAPRGCPTLELALTLVLLSTAGCPSYLVSLRRACRCRAKAYLLGSAA